MSNTNGTKGFELQPRDEAILRGLLDCRIMTIKHAAALHFDGRFEAAKKRLQKLQAAGFIAARPRRVQDPAIFSLTRKGYMSLKDEGMLDPLLELGWAKMQKRIQVSELMLRHELAVMDVKSALAPAIEKQVNLTLKEFTVNPERHAFRVNQAVVDFKKLVGFRSTTVKPDGFIHLRQNQDMPKPLDHYFFLEVDRGTETLRRLVRKAKQYTQYYRNGGFAVKCGFSRKDFKFCPFRVLIVTQSAERRNNMAVKLLTVKTPLKNLIWLTTMNELQADPLGAIWIRPSDYEKAVNGSAFDVTSGKPSHIYRRHTPREIFIDSNVRKQRLFGE